MVTVSACYSRWPNLMAHLPKYQQDLLDMDMKVPGPRLQAA